MTQHTPGPWKHLLPDSILVVEVSPDSPSSEEARIVADCRSLDFTPSMSAQHATLIAAAPDLLAALVFALETIEHRDGLKHRLDLFTADERQKLRAAIAKAEGRTQ